MRRSFALRLAAAFAGVGIAAAAMTAILVNIAFGGRFASYLEEQRSARQDQLMEGLAESYRRSDGWDPEDLGSIQAIALMDGTVRVVDTVGRPVWDASAGMGGEMSRMHRDMMGSGPLGPEQRIDVIVDGEVVGTAIVRLFDVGLLPQDRTFRTSVNQLLLAGGIFAGLLALALGVLLARRATAPARELTRAARAVAAGDRSRRVEYEGGDELGEMASAFNQMADTIEEEDKLRRTFASEVAHELRTPLAVLRTQIEGMQDGVTPVNAAALASLHEETLRLARLVADLEMLASADAAGFSLRLSRVSLRALLEDAAREFAGPFEAEAVTLETSIADGTVEADPVRLRQVVANLLSNALKFTLSGGTVRLRSFFGDGVATIVVSDTGQGVPAEELHRVFDRFFRGRGVRAGGSGIGLAVARELVVAHGGTIDVESELGTGATFTVRLPVSPHPQGGFTPLSRAPATIGAKGDRT
jgi:signal transduction histidine kinase